MGTRTTKAHSQPFTQFCNGVGCVAILPPAPPGAQLPKLDLHNPRRTGINRHVLVKNLLNTRLNEPSPDTFSWGWNRGHAPLILDYKPTLEFQLF